MKGIERSRQFYETRGRALIQREFPEYEERIAVGLVGQGSECFGFDDEFSRDHDFGERFCLWITQGDDEKIGFSLMDAYQRLCGGGNISENAALRSGVFTIDEFYTLLIGRPNAPATWQQWLSIPEQALATAVNGEVFRDDLGAFSAVRAELLKGFPEDVLLKKLSAHLALMAQAGQYNFPRCQKREEGGAAALALYEFIGHAFHVLFLFNNHYTPYYKWRFRAAKQLPLLSELAYSLERLTTDLAASQKAELIEQIAERITVELNRRGLSASADPFLEAQAKAVSKQIRDPSLRRLHLMEFGAE